MIRGPATLALGLAGDRRRGQRRQQPHPDRDPAARHQRRNFDGAAQSTRRQRLRRRGAARRRRRQFRLPRRRLRPHAQRLPHPALSLSSASAGPTHAAGAFNGRQPNSSMRTDGQVGRRLLYFRWRLRRRRGHADSTRSIAFPASRRRETNTRIDMQPDQGARPRASSARTTAAIDAIRFWAASPTTSTTSSANEGGFDGVQQTFTNKEQEAASKRSCAVRPALRDADHRVRRAGRASGPDRARREARPVRPQPHTTASPATCSTNSSSPTHRKARSPAASSRSTRRRHRSPDLLVDPDAPIGARPRDSRQRAAAVGFLQDLPLGPGRQPDRAICRARAACAPNCSRAASTTRPRPSTSAIPNLKIESAQVDRDRLAARARAVPLRGHRLLHAASMASSSGS